jgi:phage protein D
MNIVKLSQESITQGGFYVPRFEVRIEGVGLPRNVLRDVIQITYKDNIKEIDSVELTVNNWDPTIHDFKYIGSETSTTLKTNPLYMLFEPCNKEVQVSMGYGSNLTVMLTGTFTTMEPKFPSSGAPTLTVRALDILHKLRAKQYTKTWRDTNGIRDSDIVKNIETLMDQGKKRFPLPIEIDKNARNDEPILPIVTQHNQYDIDFILTRARERGYVVFIKEADKDRKLPRRLYFGPSEGRVSGLRDVTFELERGKSLIEFMLTLTTATQAKSVTVSGWDRRKKKAITGKATLKQDIKLNSDLKDLFDRCDPRDEVVVEVPVFTEKEAQALAKSLLEDRFKEVVKASGTTLGLPDLRAGQWVMISGIGSRLSGRYFVTDTTHTIDDKGYYTSFHARREDEKLGGLQA